MPLGRLSFRVKGFRGTGYKGCRVHGLVFVYDLHEPGKRKGSLFGIE